MLYTNTDAGIRAYMMCVRFSVVCLHIKAADAIGAEAAAAASIRIYCHFKLS